MLANPVPERRSLLKNPLLYSSAVLGAALLGVLYVMLSRWQDNRMIERQAAQRRIEKQREQDRLAVDQLGGKNFAILDFYASPRVIRRGQSAQLCYGVSNAKTVQLDPQSQPVWPSASHCVDVSPTKTTTYTLTIADASGQKKSQSVDLVVQ